MRRIQKSGGFLSFPSERLHFGLGEGKESFSTEIIWSSGKKDQLHIRLKRGYHYLVVKE